jgi:hypothetical protein
MKVLLDADMIAHEVGHIHDDETGELLEWGRMKALAKGRFWSIFHKAQGTSIESWVSGGENFRHDIATIRPYKGNRDGAERHCADAVKQYLADELNATYCEGIEADDAIATRMWEHYRELWKQHDGDDYAIARDMEMVIASRDKDLVEGVPGWHFSWRLKKQEAALGAPRPNYVPFVGAIRSFYKQMLTGDTADNIPGLYNIGEKSAWVAQLDDLDTEGSMHLHVMDKYKKYFGAWARNAFREVGALLHLERSEGDRFIPFDER